MSDHNNHHSTQGFRNKFQCKTKQILNLADGYSQRDEKQFWKSKKSKTFFNLRVCLQFKEEKVLYSIPAPSMS